MSFQVTAMHKVFGIKENVEYFDREGVYLIPFHNNLVGIVQTSKGYFFLGGGLEAGESHSDCIHRECIEEAGFVPFIKEKVCSAESYINHPTIGYFHPVQTYYIGGLNTKISVPTEDDHHFLWVDREQLRGKMFLEMQNWALEQVIMRVSANQE